MKTPRADQCRPPRPGPVHTPEHAKRLHPELWAEAVELVRARGFVHGTELNTLAIAHGLPHSGESLVQALCHPDGPATYAEYVPDHSQRAFAGLGPSAYLTPEVHPLAWYIARKSGPIGAGGTAAEDRTWCSTCDGPVREITGSSRYCAECDEKSACARP